VVDALPNAALGNRVLVLSAWLHYALGNTLAQIVEVFDFHLQMKISAGGLVDMWYRLQAILFAWYEEIRKQALASAVLHADETHLARTRQNAPAVVLLHAGFDVLHDRSCARLAGAAQVFRGRIRRHVGERLLGRLQRGLLRGSANVPGAFAARERMFPSTTTTPNAASARRSSFAKTATATAANGAPTARPC
jgi:hypothetical protein